MSLVMSPWLVNTDAFVDLELLVTWYVFCLYVHVKRSKDYFTSVFLYRFSATMFWTGILVVELDNIWIYWKKKGKQF